MQSLRPASAAAMTAHRREAIKLAQGQEKAVLDRYKRSGEEAPGYSFDELIGKGSFGRVYKGRQLSSNKVVAIKVLEIDDADFHAFGDQKDEQIRDFNREIQILRRAQDSGAENLNQMIEALPIHSQLWLICEHCPGGSVKTLMRATNDRLEEKYLIVVARELAKALKGLHHAGIMHRDVKAANVLIHENGGLQLCDFGVAAALEGHTDKRRTFIGTLHWMPPELWDDKPEYSDEVDVWGYGCTLYECALGRPPNSDVRERQQLKVRMRRLKQSISLPEKEDFSEGLRSLVKYALNPDAASRPSMHDILQHDFLSGTEESYPTSCLADLVQTYYGWLFSGGQRVSLFMPGGAAPAFAPEDDLSGTVTDEWNFSMTQDFERRMSAILEIPDLSNVSAVDFAEGEATPRAPPSISALFPPKHMTATEMVNFERRVQRGADLSNLFDADKPAYEYKTKTDFVPVKEPERRISDLPFRAMAEDRPASIASVAIDLGDFDEADYAMVAPRSDDDRIQTTYAAATPLKEEMPFKLADAATIRAKRADSKGPRDPTTLGMTAKRTSSVERDESVDGRSSYDGFGSQDNTVGHSLQAAAASTPTIQIQRPKERDTMGWSFAAAMDEVTQKDPQTLDGHEEEEIAESAHEPAFTGLELDEKAKKHATLDWSFSMAMAEAEEQPLDDQLEDEGRPDADTTPGRRTRPRQLLRTMTEPITSHEVDEALMEDMPRPSTAMSEAYSESSQGSTDFDPFALEQDTRYNHHHQHTFSYDEGPGGAELDDVEMSLDMDVNMNDFYTTRGRAMIPPDMHSGPGPDFVPSGNATHQLSSSELGSSNDVSNYQTIRNQRIEEHDFNNSSPGPAHGHGFGHGPGPSTAGGSIDSISGVFAPFVSGLTSGSGPPADVPSAVPALHSAGWTPSLSSATSTTSKGIPLAPPSVSSSASPRRTVAGYGHSRGASSSVNHHHLGPFNHKGSGSSTSSVVTSSHVPTSVNGSQGSLTSVGAVNGNVSSMNGVNGRGVSTFALPTPAPPSFTAMTGDASADVVERELERLLGEFQNALGVAGQIVGEGARGRTRRRRAGGGMSGNGLGIGGAGGIGGSGSEWEDEE